MFMYPEPAPLDYRLTEINPSFVADGIFYHGKPTATHKFVAKQLVPIKRKLSDPLAPVQELDSLTLNRHLERSKELYVAQAGKDDGLIFQTLSIMPKWKREYRGGPKSMYAIFPRSPQYELQYVREKRLKDFAKGRTTVVECTKKEEILESDYEPCGLLKPPFWWKESSGKARKLPVGNINDYAYEKLKIMDGGMKISERLEMDHPKKYIPGVIHRIQNPEDTSMQDTLKRADAFKVVLKVAETPLDKPPVDECVQPMKKSPFTLTCCNEKAKDEDIEIPDRIMHPKDKRWWSPGENMPDSKSDIQREEELRYLNKPFLHELHTWYAKNKPTKLIIPVKQVGKRAIPEKRFSHL